MAALIKRGNQYHVKFYYRGKQYLRSLSTEDERDADQARKAAERRIHLLRTGAVDVPKGTEPGTFIVEGKPTNPEDIKEEEHKRSVNDLLDEYLDAAKPPRKAESSWKTERTHVKNFRKFLCRRAKMPLVRMTGAVIEEYASFRAVQVKPNTVNKELQTLAQAFDFAVRHDYMASNPVSPVQRFKNSSVPHRFMTKSEIDEHLGKAGLSDAEKNELRHFRYLTPEETRELLALAEHSDLWAFLYVLAYTGIRFGEARALQWEDVDFKAKKIWVRSRKQSKTRQISMRDIEMNDALVRVLKEHREFAPNGGLVFCDEDGLHISPGWFRYHFNDLIKETPFEGIGFHCLRHSFSSNLASSGVDDRLIDHFMGHQTDEMRRRYQHLFPSDRRRAIDKIPY